MKIDQKARYLESHEWVRTEGGHFVCGLSDYAVDQVGEIVFIELPDAGSSCEKGENFSAIESVKAANDLYAPLSGEIVEVNDALDENPELINEDPYGDGWICKIKASSEDELESLLSPAAYEKMINEADG